MKFASLLFAAGVTGVFLSGCYVDRKPTMTLEDRMMASDAELAEYRAAKKVEAEKTVETQRAVVAELAVVDPGSDKPCADADALFRLGEYHPFEFSGRKFTAGTRPLAYGRNVVYLVVWAQSASREWRKIVSAECGVDGVSRVVVDDNAGFVALMVKKPGATSETEVFRYDLHLALR